MKKYLILLVGITLNAQTINVAKILNKKLKLRKNGMKPLILEDIHKLDLINY